MATTEPHTGQERRSRDRSAGIRLRRRQNQLPDKADDRRRRSHDGIDIASALELHLDLVTTRRGMITLLESWLHEGKNNPSERDESYVRAVERAIEVMSAAPDPVSAIAVLQRAQS